MESQLRRLLCLFESELVYEAIINVMMVLFRVASKTGTLKFFTASLLDN